MAPPDPAVTEDPCAGHEPVFLGGLHRSGTTALARLLAENPEVSGFSGTQAKEDEGQHLQDVYPPARAYGGAGRFAFDPRSHLVETSPLATPENAAQLWRQWAPHWDLNRRLLVEKSPPNLVMTRFLQRLYPCSRFVIIVRHPVVVALSTRKWRQSQSLTTTVNHWVRAHQTFRADAHHLDRLHVLRYEDLVTRPDEEVARLSQFLQLSTPLDPGLFDPSHSDRYIKQWEELRTSPVPWRRLTTTRMSRAARDELAHWGYRVPEVTSTDPLPSWVERTGDEGVE